MANIRKLLLWKTSLKGISNTEGTPDLHVPPAPVVNSRDSTTLEPINFYSYSGGKYDTEEDSGYYFAKSATVYNPGGESVGDVTYAIVDPTEQARKTFSQWEIYGEPCYEVQNKWPDPYPAYPATFDAYLEDFEWAQPSSSGFEGLGFSDWRGLYTSNTTLNEGYMELESLNQRFFTAGFIEPIMENPNWQDTNYFAQCVWPLEQSTIPTSTDHWINPTVDYQTRGFNWKYRWLDKDGSQGWTNPTYTGTKWDMKRFTKTVQNTCSLAANYWLTSYYTDTPGVWNEFDGATLSTGEIPGWQLWYDGRTDPAAGSGFDPKINTRFERTKEAMSAGIARTFSDQGDSINIGFEIELALHRVGVTISDGYDTNFGGGNYGNLKAYRAGHFTFSHPGENYISGLYNEDDKFPTGMGAYIYIPVYAQFELYNRNAGDIPTVIPEQIARYLVVAIRLRQKYNVNTIVHGSGIVLDASSRLEGGLYQISDASAIRNGFSTKNNRMWDGYVSFPSTRVYYEERRDQAVSAPVTCYRLSEDGRYHFISGGNKGTDINTGSPREKCISRFVIGDRNTSNVGNDRSKAFAGPSQYFQGGYHDQYWGRTSADGYHFAFSEVSSSGYQDVKVVYLPGCSSFPGYDSTYIANRYTSFLNQDYDGFRISCFRWSNDSRFLYVMWDDAGEDGRKPNSGSNRIRAFIERYYFNDSLRGEAFFEGAEATSNQQIFRGLYWCGKSSTTYIDADTSKTESPYIYPPSSFDITPDGLYCQVLFDPYREGKPFVTEHFLGGDDLKTVDEGGASFTNLIPTSPEYAFANWDPATISTNNGWTKTIYWPEIGFAPGVIAPSPWEHGGTRYVSRDSAGLTGGPIYTISKTYIVLGWSWVNQYEYLTNDNSTEHSNFPTKRREVDTYPSDFDWSVDGTTLFLFQRYQDSDYGSRLSGSNRGMMELDDQPIMLQVCMNRNENGTYGEYPYIHPGYTNFTGKNRGAASKGYAFHYAHRIYGFQRETKDRYITGNDQSNIAYTAYWPTKWKTNFQEVIANTLCDAISINVNEITYLLSGNPDVNVLQLMPSSRNGTSSAGLTEMIPDSYQVHLDPATVNTANWNYNPYSGVTYTRRRYLDATDHIVLARSDSVAVSGFYNEFLYELKFGNAVFSGRTIHITDAAGNDLSGKDGVTITGTPGDPNDPYVIQLMIRENGTAAPGRIVDYNPFYIRVDSNTSDLGFKVYHEAPLPIQQIATPLASVDNLGPEKPGNWATARSNYFTYERASVPYTNAQKANGDQFNPLGYFNEGLTSLFLKTRYDSATYNVAKNGRFINFIGAVELGYWDAFDADTLAYNQRIYTQMINSEPYDTFRKFFALESVSKRTPYGYTIGNRFDIANFDDQTSEYYYFNNGSTYAYREFIMHGPWNGRTEWGNTIKLTEVDGYSSWALPTLEAPPPVGFGNTPINFDLNLTKNVASYYQGDLESLSTGSRYVATYKQNTDRTYSEVNLQGNTDSYFSRKPPGFSLAWPEDLQGLSDNYQTDYKGSLISDRRGGKDGLWFALNRVTGSGGFSFTPFFRDATDFVRGTNDPIIDRRFSGTSAKNKTGVVSNLVNGTFLTSAWTTLNSIVNRWDLPPWRFNKRSLGPLNGSDNEEDKSSGYVLSFMDLEPGPDSVNKNRQYSVKRKYYDGLNFHTTAFAQAQGDPPLYPDEVWNGYPDAHTITTPDTAADGFQAYLDVNGSVQLTDINAEYNLADRALWSIRSVKYVNGGNKLAILASGKIRDIATTGPGPISAQVVNLPGFCIYFYDLPTPYSLKDATYDKAFAYTDYIGSVSFFASSWWNSNGNRVQQQYGSDFVFKDDGTKFWVIGVETNAGSYPIRPTNIQTNLYEFSLSSAWDMSTASYSNQTVYDNLAYDSSYDYEVPCDLSVSPDGSTVYWGTYNPIRNSSFEDKNGIRMDHFSSPLSQNWNLLSPTSTTVTPVNIQGFSGNRIQVGTRWYAKDGAGQKVRFINEERWYRTNAASNVDGTTDTSVFAYKNAQNWPSGGASSFDVDKSTQKNAGSFSFGNMGMFPHVPRQGVDLAGNSDYYYEAVRDRSSGADIFSFDISPSEDRAVICDGQTTVYGLKFNNDTKGFG